MSQEQGYRAQSIFRSTPKPFYSRPSIVSYVFGQNRLPGFVVPLLLLLALVSIIWYSYPKVGEEDIVPIIQADPTAYRHIPNDPGGMDVAHQDSTVFEPLETRTEKPESEQLLVSEEFTFDRSMIFKNKPARHPDFKPMMDSNLKPKLNLDLKLEQTGAVVEELISREETVPTSLLKNMLQNPDKLEKNIIHNKEKQVDKPIVSDVQETIIPMKAEPIKLPVVKTTIVKTIEPKHKSLVAEVKKVTVKPSLVKKRVVKSSPVADGVGWVVQLGAFGSQNAADLAWKKESRKYPTVLGGHSYNVRRVDLGNKGVFYRLRMEKFEGKSSAISFCNQLKAKGGSCIATK